MLGGSVAGSRERIAAGQGGRGRHRRPRSRRSPRSSSCAGSPRSRSGWPATPRRPGRWPSGSRRQPGVARVYHPDLPSHPQHAVAARQFPHASGMLAFELAGGPAGARAAGGAFIDALTIPERTASLGSIHTIVAHPPTTTHRQYDAAQLAEAGIARRAAPLLGRAGGPRRPDRRLRPGARGGPRGRAAADRRGRGRAVGRGPPRRPTPSPSAPARGRHRHARGRSGRRPGPPGSAEPARPGDLAAAHLGRLRGRPDHRPRRHGASSG